MKTKHLEASVSDSIEKIEQIFTSDNFHVNLKHTGWWSCLSSLTKLDLPIEENNK